MNNRKIEKLKVTIEVLQEQLEELEKSEKDLFKPCDIGLCIGLNGELIHSNRLLDPNKTTERARIFETKEIARKVDDIISPSYFIAQYVFKHCPDFKTDFYSDQTHYYLFKNSKSESYVVAYTGCEIFGAVYMPKKIADDLCELLNNGDYQLA